MSNELGGAGVPAAALVVLALIAVRYGRSVRPASLLRATLPSASGARTPPRIEPTSARPPASSRWHPSPRFVSLVVAGLIVLLALGACDTTPDTKPVGVEQSPTTTAARAVVTTSATVVTTPMATSTSSPGARVALDVLAQTPVENEHQGGYDRALFPTDQATVSGCDIRFQVMERDTKAPTTIGSGCRVLTGSWTSAYDGVVTTDASVIDIDHVVALKEAWDSGAWSWDTARRGEFATDLTDSRTLRAVTSKTNASKGDRDPSNWMPPAKADECPYLADWISIKARWGLAMDQSEAGRIRNLINADCAGLAITPWAAAPASAVTPTTAATSTSEKTTAPTTAVPTTGATEPYYANCTAARAAGVAPLHLGDPGYRKALDRDGDGIACE